MKGWLKLGTLFDKKNEPGTVAPPGDAGTGKGGGGLVSRLGSMVASLEKRIAEAFNRGQVAARRFNGADLLVLPQTRFEEVKEAPVPKHGLAVGRFDHIYMLNAPSLEEVKDSEHNTII